MKTSSAPATLKPILFNTEMVRAILAGEKTCTRRIAKSEKPPFVVGDILYVRETWCINTFGTHYRADWPNGACPEMDCDDQWHPSIHMGKDIARIFLRVKSVERGPLRGMEVADFQKEGVKPQNRPGGCKCAWAQEYYGYAVLARKIGQIIHDTVEVDTSRATEPIFSKTLF